MRPSSGFTEKPPSEAADAVAAGWQDALPALSAECAARWGLTLEAACSASRSRAVIPARLADDTPVVLKLAPPPWLADEARALVHWNGAGAVRLLASDLSRGALLLERAEPGVPLASLCARDDPGATAEAARVMGELHRAPPGRSALPHLSTWIEALEQTRLPSTPPPLQRAGIDAVREGRQLLARATPPVVLHGDLHHDNILSARREPWLAIDPKGVIGPREADAAALLRNPRAFVLSHSRADLLIRDRIRLIAETTGLEPEALRLWGWVLAVVAAWWSFEDRETGWEHWLACGNVIQRSG